MKKGNLIFSFAMFLMTGAVFAQDGRREDQQIDGENAKDKKAVYLYNRHLADEEVEENLDSIQSDIGEEIKPENLPLAVTEEITDSEYANWTISKVYEIEPEIGEAYVSESQDDTQKNETIYEVYFLDPATSEVERQRFDNDGIVR